MNDLIDSAAADHKVPPALVHAMVQVESSGNTWAWNPEPHYRYLWDVKRNRPFRPLTAAEQANERPPSDFACLAGDRDQEWWAQQASWGLMQVMGAVARERGFNGEYLPRLCDPLIGLEYGCRHLAMLRKRYFDAWRWDGVIAAYNAGSVRHSRGSFENQGYVNKVRAALGGASI